VLHKAFKMALVGMHPQLHPAARPDWSQRALVLRLFEESLTQSELNDVMLNCATCTKEAIRLYMCSVMQSMPASRAALSKVQNSIGLLRSAPEDLIQPALAAAAQNIAAAGISAAASLSDMRSGKISTSKGNELVKNVILSHIGNEPRVRSRSSAISRPIQVSKKAHDVGTQVVLRDEEMTSFYAVAYNPSWFGRTSGENDDDAECDEHHAGAQSGNSLNIMSVIHELTSRAFRATFIPFWVHGHGNSIRTSRFDESQFDHMLATSVVHNVIKNIDERVALSVQRLAMRDPRAATSSISQIGARLRLPESDRVQLEEAKTFEEAINSVCSLSPESGARMLLFGKITILKNKFLSFDLGPKTRKRQIDALLKRFEIDDSSEGWIKALPNHSYHLYLCLECKRIPNACVDDKSKMVTHNEVGLAQTMLRVGGVQEESEIRCARRSSAALRTAVQKESEAVKNRVECIDVTEKSLRDAMLSNGDVSHAARLRRDLRTCGEQHRCALACGDRKLIRISLLGRVVRVQGRFYGLCTFCGSIVQINQTKRFDGDLCCCRCDASMVGLEKPQASQATRVAVEVDTTTTRPAPRVFKHIVPSDKLHCRFCNKAPPTSATAARFKLFRTPCDTGGRNAHLPAPLRMIGLCQSHYRPWVETALSSMSLQVIFAHISSKATPVFGADVGRRNMALTYRKSTPQAVGVKKQIMKRVKEMRTLGKKR
jgi:hypothetical protein